ncbi:3-hydroxyacyl-ACP dehydratase FabZ family protein [Metabacillus sp. Hm71]|uniref:3-hydroxyacyl-ACP dehydratase FabZ family protein n=1 Tax=Metabacillus sp. Hm71 TaxID=3450743 RepID=UPI003F41D5F0
MNSNDSIIQTALPHRYPFLMVDKVIEIVEGKKVKGLKMITENEWYISNDHTFMPNILVIEALAQLGAFVSLEDDNHLGFLTSIKGVEFIREASVGDQVHLFYEVIRMKKGFVLGKGYAEVNGKAIVKVDEIVIYQTSSSNK